MLPASSTWVPHVHTVLRTSDASPGCVTSTRTDTTPALLPPLPLLRGLKSFRTSPWDPKESLPAEYARVFAFESFKRAQKRAREAVARADVDPGTVLTGAWQEAGCWAVCRWFRTYSNG